MGMWWEQSVRAVHADAGEVDAGECERLIGEPVRYALVAIRGDRAVHSSGPSGGIASMFRFVGTLPEFMWWWPTDAEASARPRVTRALAVTHDSIIELALDEGRHPVAVTARYARPSVRIGRIDPYWYRLGIAHQPFWVRRDLGKRLRSYAAAWPPQ